MWGCFSSPICCSSVSPRRQVLLLQLVNSAMAQAGLIRPGHAAAIGGQVCGGVSFVGYSFENLLRVVFVADVARSNGAVCVCFPTPLQVSPDKNFAFVEFATPEVRVCRA